MAERPKPLHAALAAYNGHMATHDRRYADLHEHVLALAREGLLVVVDEPISKDTEMHPLVRWQFRGGIPDSGIQNVGNYRGQLKTPRRLGMNPSVELRAGIYAHWRTRRSNGMRRDANTASRQTED